jgi:hypothetical protein
MAAERGGSGAKYKDVFPIGKQDLLFIFKKEIIPVFQK